MDEGGDTMVSSDDVVVSHDRTDYAIPVDLEERPSKHDNNSLNSHSSEVPEYATITSRLRQHDPPSYTNHMGDPSSSRNNTEDDIEKEDSVPEDDIGRSRSREEEDKIEVLDTLLEEEPKRPGANGYPPGAGWAIGITGAAIGLGSKSEKGDDDIDAAKKNAKILEQFEDKQKDECLVDCLYYTTTCCECIIL